MVCTETTLPVGLLSSCWYINVQISHFILLSTYFLFLCHGLFGDLEVIIVESFWNVMPCSLLHSYQATNILGATDTSKMLLPVCGIVCDVTCHKTRWSLRKLTSCGYWTWGSTVIDEELEVMVSLYKVFSGIRMQELSAMVKYFVVCTSIVNCLLQILVKMCIYSLYSSKASAFF